MKMTRITAAAFAISSVISATAAMAESATANGEVKKIDTSANKITIKHGPIKALDMGDPMTMVYKVKDPAMLKTVKVGDKIKFDLDHDANGYTVTKIQK